MWQHKMKVQYNLKIEKSDIKLIKKVTSARGDEVSNFIRLSIRKELARMGFLSKEESKALGVERK